MRDRIAEVYKPVSILRAILAHFLNKILVLVLRVWRWVDALDIPLSPLQWVLLFYFVFGAAYLTATPVFEANDEIWHFGYIRHLRQTSDLPVQQFDGVDTIYQQHGSQPPLYYALLSILTAPLEIDDEESYRQLNPHAITNQPDAYGNKNLTIRDQSQSWFRGTGLVVLVARVVGLGLGGGTIVFIYRIGGLISPQRPTVAFVAAAITGLNPMYIFVSASVSNDSLAMLLNGALVYLMLRTLRDGFQLRSSVVIALLFALSGITKLTGLVLLPVLLGVAVLVLRKTKDRRGVLTYLYLLALIWLLIAGWWYLRNFQLYGEPLGIVTMANIAGPRGMTFDLVDVFADFQQFRMSFWGLFGALNIQVTSIFYVLLDLMSLLSAIGFVFLILQLLAISDFAYARYELAHLLTLLSAFIFLVFGIFALSLLTPVVEGRIAFPLIAVVSPLLAVGLVETVWWIVFSLRPPNLEFVRAGDAVPKELLHESMLWQLRILGIVALFAPLTVIATQYGAPQPIAELPAKAQEVYAEYGDVALVAYERIDRRYSAGDRVRLKLYWKVLEQSAADKSISLNLVDDNQHIIGRYRTFPGAGSLRTSRWQPGAIYPDEYQISVDQAAYGRYAFDLRVEWEDLNSKQRYPATNAEGEAIEPVLLNIGAVVTVRLQSTVSDFNEIASEMQPKFDDAIILESFRLDLEVNEVILNWKTEQAPTESYTVFAHMLDAEGNILTQADAPPRLPTKYWRWGESYTTYHRFAGEYNMIDHQVIVGLYVNDGLTFPRAEYTVTLSAEDAALTEAAPSALETAEASETALAEDGDLLAIAEDTLLVFDSFTIPWEVASEVIALTPTPEPTAEDEGDSSEAEKNPSVDAPDQADGATN